MINLARAIQAAMLVIICTVLFVMPAAASDKLAIAVNQSRVLPVGGVSRVAVANPEIADVLVISGFEVLLVGKAPGITSLHIWSAAGRSSFSVEVSADDLPIANEIKNILGYSDIRVSKINKTIILEGTVNDQYQKSRAEKVAGAYGEKVVNLLEIVKPVQVKIEARVLEINREKINSIGVRWGNNPGMSPGVFGLGQTYANSSSSLYNQHVPNSLGRLGTNAEINAQIDLLVKNGLAKILSQPNVITLSGDKANIVVGGEIPVPVGLDNGRIMIEWKTYGIKLEIAPEVNNEGLINSKIKAEVSSLDWNDDHMINLGANLKIPPIKLRRAEAAIAMSSGQTMALGGLISSEILKDYYKIPLLGDLPVVGRLFTSTAFSRGETELVILITPAIVNPAEYVPDKTEEMTGFINENPWGGGTGNVKKDKSAGR